MNRFWKAALSLMLCLALLGSGAACFGEGETLIFDAEGLAAIAQDPSGRYALAADIDLGGADWTPIPFSGTLDGRGRTIYNLHVTAPGAEERETRDGNLKSYNTSFAALFSTLEDAEVRDLKLRGALVEITSDRHCFAALLAGYIDHSRILGCSVEGRVSLIGNAVMVGTGGLAGYGCGEIADCAVDTEIFFEDRCYTARCEQFMGGLLACGIADIERCRVSIRGYDSCSGYVHNGGMVGMYYLCGMDYHNGLFNGNYVEGFISFFEDNPDRRAYCEPFRGESLSGVRSFEDNREDFERRETWDYSHILRPESCSEPAIVDELVPSGCDSWGYTRHSCALCGHSWVDSYTAPAHTPGEWETVEEVGVGQEGRERRSCSVCGAVLGERVLAAIVPVESFRITGAPNKALRPGETLALTAEVLPENATDRAVRWTSSDENVLAVDEDGTLFAVGRGRAVIGAETGDGFTDSCRIAVRLSFRQWLQNLFS